MADRPITNTRPGLRRRSRRPREAARARVHRPVRALGGAVLLGLVLLGGSPPAATLAAAPPPPPALASPGLPGPTGGSLESAASRAGDTGRKIGLSLIGLALAVAAVILVFKRDFKEAVGVIAIGIVAVLLVSPAGVNVLKDTVSMLFGSN